MNVSDGSTLLTPAQYIDAIATNSARLADVARLDLTLPIPTCPGWTMAILVAHLGEVQRGWAHHINQRAQQQSQLPAEVWAAWPGLGRWYQAAMQGQPDMSALPDRLIEWLTGATAELVQALRGVEKTPDERIWHWSGDHRASVHIRNQAMEATIHRWDAENAAGPAHTTPVDPALALDGIEQHFEVHVAAARLWGNFSPGRGETYHFHRTDGHGEWLARFAGKDVTLTHEHARGDIALRGTAEQLWLWFWGRIPAEQLEVFGDRALIARYRELVPPD